MLTCCPHCHSWFRVRAAQLGAAGGRVTCGTCDRVFDALATLTEEDSPPRLDGALATADTSATPAPAAAPTTPAVGAAEAATPAATEVEADAAEADAAEADAAEADAAEADAAEAEAAEAEAAEAEAAEVEAAEVEAAEVEAAEVEAAEVEAAEVEAAASDPGVGDIHLAGPALADRRDVDDSDDVPAVLREDYAALARQQARPPRARRRWLIACVLLGAALAVQLALVERAALAGALPATQPLITALCARLPCPPDAADDGSGLRLVARDVREHPQYEDALLVNATLVNSGASATAFPVIELVLLDGGGHAIGARRFAPGEYLDHSIAVDAGMPPEQPVFIVIELAVPGRTATSFEFRFL